MIPSPALNGGVGLRKRFWKRIIDGAADYLHLEVTIRYLVTGENKVIFKLNFTKFRSIRKSFGEFFLHSTGILCSKRIS